MQGQEYKPFSNVAKEQASNRRLKPFRIPKEKLIEFLLEVAKEQASNRRLKLPNLNFYGEVTLSVAKEQASNRRLKLSILWGVEYTQTMSQRNKLQIED